MPGPTGAPTSTMSASEIIARKDKLTTAELLELDAQHNAANYACLPIVLKRGEGPFVWDVEDKRYFDFLACYSAVNQGHRHPKILEAVREQLDRMTLCSRAFYGDILCIFAKYITEYFGYERVLPMNSGAEAVETAIKLSRKWGYDKKGIPDGQAKIIFALNNFHGRTTTVISASTNPQAYTGFGPLTPGFIHIEYNNPTALKEVLEREGPNVAAVILEPLQGEGGVRPPTPGYLKSVKELCEKHKCLFVCDEIQTGIGRTGKVLCVEHDGVRPDVVILGKALSGGMMPVSAILADTHIMSAFTPNSHGSTFGGNPLACATAMAALSVLKEEKMCENSERMGKVFRDEMNKLKEKVPFIHEVRGMGLMNAVEVTKDSPVSAWDICVEMSKNGLLAKPTHETTIRFTPALVITEAQIKEAVGIISSVFLKFAQK